MPNLKLLSQKDAFSGSGSERSAQFPIHRRNYLIDKYLIIELTQFFKSTHNFGGPIRVYICIWCFEGCFFDRCVRKLKL